LKFEKIKHGFKTLAECRGIRGVDGTSISSGTFVDAWKRAGVVPLYKAGDENLHGK
jgi:hypothetical protein